MKARKASKLEIIFSRLPFLGGASPTPSNYWKIRASIKYATCRDRFKKCKQPLTGFSFRQCFRKALAEPFGVRVVFRNNFKFARLSRYEVRGEPSLHRKVVYTGSLSDVEDVILAKHNDALTIG